MLISHDRKYVFVAVPKTGSTAVHYALGGTIPDATRPEDHHQGISDLLAKYPECANYFKFAFVRNPWDRFVSAYHNFTQEEEHLEWSEPICEYRDFHDFCTNFPQTKWINWIHFRPQLNVLSCEAALAVDYVGRFEHLSRDFARVCRHLNLPLLELDYVRRSEHRPYREYYTSETKAVVARCYKPDIEAFGYCF
jgi:chondroitin 4-sulfotransferase 11